MNSCIINQNNVIPLTKYTSILNILFLFMHQAPVTEKCPSLISLLIIKIYIHCISLGIHASNSTRIYYTLPHNMYYSTSWLIITQYIYWQSRGNIALWSCQEYQSYYSDSVCRENSLSYIRDISLLFTEWWFLLFADSNSIIEDRQYVLWRESQPLCSTFYCE